MQKSRSRKRRSQVDRPGGPKGSKVSLQSAPLLKNNGHSSTTAVPLSGPCGILLVYFIREIAFMARCEICNKGPIYGNRVSHAHNLTRRRWNPNLQRVRVLDGKTHKSMRVCTSCIRSGRITKA